MIEFEPPYKGTDKLSHFALIVHGVVLVRPGELEAICIDAEGDLVHLPLKQVNVDWRFDPAKRTFISIDDPSTEV